MTNVKKRTLIISAIVLSVALIAAVCVSVFFPRKTIADLLYLTSKSQIESVMLVSYYSPQGEADKPKEYSSSKDITGTALAQQYIDTIFEKPVALQEYSKLQQEKFKYIGWHYFTASEIRITVANVGEDYPIVEKEFTISCNNELELCDVPEVFLSYDYTTDYIRKRFEQNSARGIQEELKNSESYVFIVPGEKLFTTGFIKEQLGISE